MKEFDKPIPKEKLDILDKTRSNLFAWRGQFSPQLVEVILNAYCLPDSVILDPFAGSGTVLLEAGILELEAYGFEINPAAWILSKNYELINNSRRKEHINKLRKLIDKEFPFRIFEHDEEVENLSDKLKGIRRDLEQESKRIFDALVILLDVANNKVTNEFVQSRFTALANLIENFP